MNGTSIGYEATLRFLENKGDEGVSLGETLNIGISRLTFFRHKKLIEQVPGISLETFLGLDGVFKFIRILPLANEMTLARIYNISPSISPTGYPGGNAQKMRTEIH